MHKKSVAFILFLSFFTTTHTMVQDLRVTAMKKSAQEKKQPFNLTKKLKELRRDMRLSTTTASTNSRTESPKIKSVSPEKQGR